MPSGAGVSAAQPRIKFVRGTQTRRVITHLRASWPPVSFLKSKQEEEKRLGPTGVFGGEAAADHPHGTAVTESFKDDDCGWFRHHNSGLQKHSPFYVRVKFLVAASP